jgi:hypothetical protein
MTKDITATPLYRIWKVLSDHRKRPLMVFAISILSETPENTTRKILGGLKRLNRVKITKNPLSMYERK